MPRAIRFLAWFLPCLVLLISGGAKLLLADGTPPRLMAALTALLPYHLWLRLLGLAEILLAALVAWPRTRRRGLLLAAAVVSTFSLLVAASAADLTFVGDCGCFGGLGSSSHYYGWLVLRNALLVFLAVLGWRERWREALVALILAVAVPGVVGEMRLRVAAYRQLDATALAHRVQGYQGRALPDLTLVDGDGLATTADAAFFPGDVIAFVGPECPHCLALAPSLAALDDSLRSRQRRVVLVLTNTLRVADSWREIYRWQGRDALATLDRTNLLALGVTAVPQLLQLGPDREVQYNEAHPLPTSLWKSLRLVDGRAPGVADAVWSQVTTAIFGEGWRLDHMPRLEGAVVSAPVSTPDGRPGGRLCVVQDGWRPADTVELAVGLTDDGRIVAVVPLSAGAHARVFAPDVSVADSLAGLTPSEADALLERNERHPGLARPVWRSLRMAMARLPR